MQDIIHCAFEKEHIEAFAALPYEACRVLRPYLVERLAPFVPRAVILFLVPYYTGIAENLSCYASALDYHAYMNDLFARICPLLARKCGGSFYGFADHSPIDERHAAAVAGLGMLGENGLLIHPRYGSFVFIGELLTDISPAEIGAGAPRETTTCMGCGACRAACPTGCLCGSGKECLSAVTQKKGQLSKEEESLVRLGGSAWGCDACQRICPHNALVMHDNLVTPIPYFHKERILRLTLEELAAMSEEGFARRAFSFRGRGPLERNLRLLDT